VTAESALGFAPGDPRWSGIPGAPHGMTTVNWWQSVGDVYPIVATADGSTKSLHIELVPNANTTHQINWKGGLEGKFQQIMEWIASAGGPTITFSSTGNITVATENVDTYGSRTVSMAARVSGQGGIQGAIQNVPITPTFGIPRCASVCGVLTLSAEASLLVGEMTIDPSLEPTQQLQLSDVTAQGTAAVGVALELNLGNPDWFAVQREGGVEASASVSASRRINGKDVCAHIEGSVGDLVAYGSIKITWLGSGDVDYRLEGKILDGYQFQTDIVLYTLP
jgi:hypothetical protein